MSNTAIEVKDFYEALEDFMEWAGTDDVELKDVEKEGDHWTATFSKIK